MKRARLFLFACVVVSAVGQTPGHGQDKTKESEGPKKGESGLVGAWRMDTIAGEGLPPAKDKGKTLLILLKDGEFVMRFGTEVLYGTYETDAATKPAKMDMKIINSTFAALKEKTQLCIFELDGDTLTLCRANAGKDRPTQFETKRGSGHVLQVYKRVNP